MKDFNEIMGNYRGTKAPNEEYFEKYKTLIPMSEMKGNEVLLNEFNGSTMLVYAYCLNENKTWEEVLGYREDENQNHLY